MTIARARNLALRVLFTMAHVAVGALATVELTGFDLTAAGVVALAAASAGLAAVKEIIAEQIGALAAATGTKAVIARAGWTALQAGVSVAALAPSTDLVSADLWQSAAFAAITTGVALAKGVIEQLASSYLVETTD